MSSRRSRAPWSALVAALPFLVACSLTPDLRPPSNDSPGAGFLDTGSPADPDGSAEAANPTGAVPPDDHPACGAAKHVSTAADVQAIVDAVSWGARELRTDGANLSTDLVFDADVTLDTQVLSVPGTCDPTPGDCSSPIDLRIASTYGTCATTVPASADAGLGASRCSSFTFKAGAALRILKVQLSYFGSGVTPAMIDVPACSAPCAPTERRCAALQVCMTDAPPQNPMVDIVNTVVSQARGQYCTTCLGEPAATCACFSFEGSLPQGQACSYPVNDDVNAVGSCQASRCVTE
jgi:hypothetical protein